MKKDIQSRRQFFKKAAKGALPILGAIALSQLPLVGSSHEAMAESGCNYGCSGNCVGHCDGSCLSACTTSCYTTCRGGCYRGCTSLNQYG